MAKPIARNISSARAELPELFEAVAMERVPEVVIAHRDFSEHVLLVREVYVRQLEERIARLERLVPAPSFSLIGSAELVGDAEDVMSAVRTRQRDLAAAKRGTL